MGEQLPLRLTSKKDFSLNKPTDSSEEIGKAKTSACSVRNDRHRERRSALLEVTVAAMWLSFASLFEFEVMEFDLEAAAGA